MAYYQIQVRDPEVEGVQRKTVEFFVKSGSDIATKDEPGCGPTLVMMAFEKVLQWDSFPRTRDYAAYRARTQGAAQRFRDELRLAEGCFPEAPRFAVRYDRVDGVPAGAWCVAYGDMTLEHITRRCEYLVVFESMRKKEKLDFWQEMLLVGGDLLEEPGAAVEGTSATDSGIARNVARSILQREIVCRFPQKDIYAMRKQMLALKSPSLAQICYGANTMYVPSLARAASASAAANQDV